MQSLLRNGSSGKYYGPWKIAGKQKWGNLDTDLFRVAKTAARGSTLGIVNACAAEHTIVIPHGVAALATVVAPAEMTVKVHAFKRADWAQAMIRHADAQRTEVSVSINRGCFVRRREN